MLKGHPGFTGQRTIDTPWLFLENNNNQITDDKNNIPDHEHEEGIVVARPQRDRNPPDRYSNLRAHVATLNHSLTYTMAINSNEKELWKAALETEINGFIERNVCTVVPRPKDQEIIT